ncbi:MAG: hypothetical protein ABRQ38_02740 [Candidatus Eremiobacterota bacterium]
MKKCKSIVSYKIYCNVELSVTGRNKKNKKSKILAGNLHIYKLNILTAKMAL